MTPHRLARAVPPASRFRLAAGIPALSLTMLSLIAAAMLPATAAPGVAAEPDGGAGHLTVYSDDLAQVTTRRRVDLPEGTSRLVFAPVSPGALADSLDLSAPGTRVRDQGLAPWPLDRATLLSRALGQTVRLRRPGEAGASPRVETATLLAVTPDLVLAREGRLLINPAGEIELERLPEGLARQPQARFRVAAESAGQREVTLRYLTRGLSWHAAYVGRWDRAAGTLDLTGRAVIESALDRTLSAEKVTLVAGEVANTGDAPSPAQPRALRATASAEALPAARDGADLKLYHLDAPLTLPPGGSVQRPLLQAREIAAEARYRLTGLATAQLYDQGTPQEAAATLRLSLPDTRAAGLDQPLPAGVMRIYDGPVFRGARRIDDTPAGAPLRLDLGSAFDVTATARQVAAERLGERRYEVERRITLRSAGPRAVQVRVVGDFPPDWEMLRESHPHTRESATRPIWTVDVSAEGEQVLSYRVRVTR